MLSTERLNLHQALASDNAGANTVFSQLNAS
ncbi:hypothetical protein EPIR_1740 [Erwinia piriflorinigrans CFBP 5888]|uniref:Uncharacterized protein n=1 Tax=Erwinia piriflorinigrans CFBP 5888 TaxID=1161919 RepID=V5Z821_9GAMM|nr:hypothetical protein EPIR_1740 [Erwinia piriflorinigrans CFBP 5888]